MANINVAVDGSNGAAARRFWMPDLAAAHCTHCSQPFTMFRRRHHCRICGKIFCHACSSQTTDGRAVGMEGVRLRVCGDCKLLEGQMLANMASANTIDQPKAEFASSDMSSPAPSSSLSREKSGGPGSSAVPRTPLLLPLQTGSAQAGKGRVYVMAQEFAGGGGGLGPFDDRARLDPPSTPWFTPGMDTERLTALATAADTHLEVLVHRAVKVYMAHASTPAQQAWAGLLLSLSRRISSALDPHVRRGDRQDVVSYLHIKKMPDREKEGKVTVPAGGAARGVRQPRVSSSLRHAVLGPMSPSATPTSPSPLSSPSFASPGTGTGPGSGSKRAAAGPCAFDGIPVRSPSSLVDDGHVGVSECVQGVVFRRTLPHKGMREDIARPRVLLLDDGLQFEVDKRGTAEGGHAPTATGGDSTQSMAGSGAPGTGSGGLGTSNASTSASGGAGAGAQAAGISTLWGGLLAGKGSAANTASSAAPLSAPQTPQAGGSTSSQSGSTAGTAAAAAAGASQAGPSGSAFAQESSSAPSRLSSLSTLIEQDPAYSDLLVSKLLSLRPDVVAISHGASSRVVDGLMRAGVTLITQCKAGVMQRVSRCTGARILPSVGFLDKVSEQEAVGTLAERFAVVHAYVPRSHAVKRGLAWPTASSSGGGAGEGGEEDEPVRVSYCTFSGCPDRLYCTVILRGLAGDLPAAAAILRYTVRAARQLRCHVAWMMDSGLLLPPALSAALEQTLSALESHGQEERGEALQHGGDAHAQAQALASSLSLRLFTHRLLHYLCPVPNVELGKTLGMDAQPPAGLLDAPWLQLIWAYLLSQRPDGTLPPRARYILDTALRLVRYRGEEASEEGTRMQVLTMLRPLLTGSVSIASFPLHPILDPLLSSMHLCTLPVTVLSHLPKQLQQCRPAAVRFMTMVSQGDRPLGDFLESYCLELPVECGHCRYSPYDHTLSLSHGTGRVDITLHRLSYTLRAEGQEGGSASTHNELVTWSYCSSCKRHVSPITRVSRGTWSMSLAAYAQQVFYGQGACLQGTDTVCTHAPMTHHVRYFGRGKQAACFKYSPQSPLAVACKTVVRSDSAWSKAACTQQCALLARAAGAVGTYLNQGLTDLRALCCACMDSLSTCHPSSIPEGLPAALTRWKEDVEALSVAIAAATRTAQIAATTLATAGNASAVADVLSVGAHRREWATKVRAVQEKVAGVQALLQPAAAQIVEIVQDMRSVSMSRGAVGRRSSVTATLGAMAGLSSAAGGDGEGGGGGTTATGASGVLQPIHGGTAGSSLNRTSGRYVSEGSVHRSSASESVGGPPSSPSASPVSTPLPSSSTTGGQAGDSRTLKQLQATCSVFSPALTAIPGPDNPAVRLMTSGHLALPPGQHGVVVPVDAGLAATCIGYNLASELYWRKLGECVRTAAKRMAALQPVSDSGGPGMLGMAPAPSPPHGLPHGLAPAQLAPQLQPVHNKSVDEATVSSAEASRERGESTSGGEEGAVGALAPLRSRSRSGSGVHASHRGSAVEGEVEDALSEISSLSDLDEEEDVGAPGVPREESGTPLPEGTTPLPAPMGAPMGGGVVAGATQAIGRLLSAFSTTAAATMASAVPPPLTSEESVGSVGDGSMSMSVETGDPSLLSTGGEGAAAGVAGSTASAGILRPILPPMLVDEDVESDAQGNGTGGQASATAVMFYPSAPGYTGVDENPADNPFGPPPTIPAGTPTVSTPAAEMSAGDSDAAVKGVLSSSVPVDVTDGPLPTPAIPPAPAAAAIVSGGAQGASVLPPVLGSPPQGSSPGVGSGLPADPPSSASLTTGLWSTPAFGTPLKLSPAEMLAVDVKSDIVHMYADMTVGSRCSFTVTAYWALQFHGLRELCTDSQRSFVQSLAHAERWEASGGKSGARFEKTCDQRFIVKHVSRTEFDMFCTHIAPAYFKHVHGSVVEGKPSLLVKILGAFKVVVSPIDDLVGVSPSLGMGMGMGSDGVRGGGLQAAQSSADAAAAAALLSRGPAYVFIMDNLFYPHPILPGMRFDLKGKVRAAKGKDVQAGERERERAQGTARPPVPSGSTPRTPDMAAEASNNPFSKGGDGNTPRTLVDGSGAAPGAGEVEGKADKDREGEKGRITPTSTPPSALPAPAAAGPTLSSQVLLDADLLAHTRGQPLPLTDAGKRWLDAALKRDTAFLCGLTVVDYSILIGIGRGKGGMVTSKGLAGLGGGPLALAGGGAGPAGGGAPTYGVDHLHVGLIDWVRRFDLIKQVESKVKTVVGAGAEPTVVQPERYANRLLTAAARYFAFVPTPWSCMPLCRPQGEGAEAWEEEDPIQTESKEAYLVGTWGVESSGGGASSSNAASGQAGAAAPSRPSHRRVHALPPCYPPSPCPPLYIGSRTQGYYSTVPPPWATRPQEGRGGQA